MPRFGYVLLVVLTLIGGLAWLGTRVQNRSSALSPTAVIGSPAPPAEDAGPPVTRRDAEQFGRELERAFNAGDVAELADRIRFEEVVARSWSDLELPADFTGGMTAGMRKGGQSPTLPPGYVSGVLPNGGRVLRVRECDGRWAVLVRLLGEDGWLNYLDFKLYRHPSGGVGVEDVFNARTGEWLTADLRGLIITAVQKGRAGGTKAATAEVDQLRRFQAGVSGGNAEAGYAEYRGLSDDWKQLRPVRAAGLWALVSLPKKRVDLASELAAYRETVPDGQDTVSALVALAFYHTPADEPKVRQALRHLEKWTGGDPFLWVVDGRYRIGLGEEAEAVRLFERAVAADPTIEEAHIHLIGRATAADDHPLTLRRLKALVEHCHPTHGFEDLTEIKALGRFVGSPEHKQYVAWLKKKRGN